MLPYFTIVLIACCAVVYYRIGEQEYDSGFVLGAVSVVLWMTGSYFLGFGSLGNLLVQAGLLIALTFWKMFRQRHP